MTNRELKNKLQLLSALKASGEPNLLWVATTREFILEQARSTLVAQELPIRLPRTGMSRFLFAMRPVMAVFVVFGFGAFGWLASMSSASGLLPGDALYRLKTVGEQAQLTFAADASARAMLHLEFAGRRANEMAAMVEARTPANDVDMALAVGELQRELNNVSSTLDEVSAGSPQAAAGVAQAVDRKLAEVHAVLGKSKGRLASNVQQKVNDAVTSADDVSVKAVAVLVQTSKSGVGPLNSDVISRVQEKIDNAEKNLMVATDEAAVQAKAALEQAKAALKKDNLEEAVAKVQESAALVAKDVESTVKIEVLPKAPVASEIKGNVNTNKSVNSNINGQIKLVD